MVDDGSERLWNTNYIKVMIANFTIFFSFYLLTPLLPLYLSETFSAGKDMIGLVLSGYTAIALFARPLSGFAIDSLPPKCVLISCFFLFFIIFAGYIVAGSLMLFAVVRTFHGAPFGALTVANSTVAVDVLPSSRRNEGIGYYGLSNNLAMAIAPSVGVYIYKFTGNFVILFWLALAVAAVGMLTDLTVKIPAELCVRNKRSLSVGNFFLVRGWMLGANVVFFGFGFGILSNYLAIYGKEILGITGGTGTYFMLLSVGLILSRLQGAKSLRLGRITNNCGEGVLISLAGYLVFVVFGVYTWGYYLSALLIGLGNGHFFPAFQNMFIKMAHVDERGTANSTLLTSWDVGVGLGVLAGGAVSEFFGYALMFWVVAAVTAVGVIFFFTLSRHNYELRKLD